MKRVVSVSLGSSSRDHAVQVEILGESFSVERIGTDGSMEKAIRLIKDLDGQVAAFGLGGIDLYIYAGSKRYVLKDAEKIAAAARITPIVDGSGLKNTLERRVIRQLAKQKEFYLKGRQVLLVCGADRFGMAQALTEEGAQVTFGDLAFGLGIPLPLKSLKSLERVATVIAPIICRMPFKYLYPTGKKQEANNPRFGSLYQDADIIAGDFLFIKKHMPENLNNKIILTNTVTSADIDELKSRGLKTLITTTPELQGRSFGTNVMEGVIVALAGRRPEQLLPSDYEEILDRLDLKPRIVILNKAKAI